MEFPEQWQHGSPDCRHDAAPIFQVHRLEEGTYALRCQEMTVASSPIKARRPEQTQLVAHTHAHADHHFGDRTLASRPNTEVVPPGVASVQAAFGIGRWPLDTGGIDLGGRHLIVVPTPGHEESHVVLYDERTKTVFSGDMLYAGLLVVHDWPAFRASASRLASFVRSHPIDHVLGSHIEMKRAAGELYPIGTRYQPEEHALQLGPRHVLELQEACEALGDSPEVAVRPDFIVQPVGD